MACAHLSVAKPYIMREHALHTPKSCERARGWVGEWGASSDPRALRTTTKTSCDPWLLFTACASWPMLLMTVSPVPHVANITKKSDQYSGDCAPRLSEESTKSESERKTRVMNSQLQSHLQCREERLARRLLDRHCVRSCRHDERVALRRQAHHRARSMRVPIVGTTSTANCSPHASAAHLRWHLRVINTSAARHCEPRGPALSARANQHDAAHERHHDAREVLYPPQ